MNRLSRLAKAEQVAGIGTPCEWCAHWEKQQRIFVEALVAQGVKLHQPKPRDLKPGVCRDCGIAQLYDQTFQSTAERREWEALNDEEKRLEREEKKTSSEWWRRFAALWDQEEERMRKFYGDAFDIARAKTDFWWVRETTTKIIGETEEREREGCEPYSGFQMRATSMI